MTNKVIKMKLFLFLFMSLLSGCKNVSQEVSNVTEFYRLNHKKAFNTFYDWTISFRSSTDSYYMTYTFNSSVDSINSKDELRLVIEKQKKDAYKITYLQEDYVSLIESYSKKNNITPDQFDALILKLMADFQVLEIENLYSSSRMGYVIFHIKGCEKAAYIVTESEALSNKLFKNYTKLGDNWYAYNCPTNSSRKH